MNPVQPSFDRDLAQGIASASKIIMIMKIIIAFQITLFKTNAFEANKTAVRTVQCLNAFQLEKESMVSLLRAIVLQKICAHTRFGKRKTSSSDRILFKLRKQKKIYDF